MNRTKTRDMVITALLTALTILIPIAFSPIRIPVGLSFTATVAVHVPIMLAMFISPVSAAMVAIGSGIGFFFSAPLVVALRAMTHVIFAVSGALMVKKLNCNVTLKLILVWLVTMILHGLFEAAITMWFWFANDAYPAMVYAESFTVGIGTLIHHTIDFVIMLGVLAVLSKSKFIDWKFKKASL